MFSLVNFLKRSAQIQPTIISLRGKRTLCPLKSFVCLAGSRSGHLQHRIVALCGRAQATLRKSGPFWGGEGGEEWGESLGCLLSRECSAHIYWASSYLHGRITQIILQAANWNPALQASFFEFLGNLLNVGKMRALLPRKPSSLFLELS